MLHENPFVQLADRAGRGDTEAAYQLRRELQPQMVRMVRHALAYGGTSPVARRIRAAADRLVDAAPRGPDDDEDFVHIVARSLCDCVLADLERPGGQALNETVRN